MATMTTLAIAGPEAWRGEELARSTDWIRTIPDEALREIETALRTVQRRGLAWHEIRREDFSIPETARLLGDVSHEPQHGRGVVLLRRLPVERFSEEELKQYSRTFVEAAQRRPGVPPLSAAQNEALDLLAEVAEEQCFRMTLEPGDIQLLNNHVIYHGRTPYEDSEARDSDRLLYRLWLSMPHSRALPSGFEVLWGSIEAGALRGGIEQPAPTAKGGAS
jgi:Taurine catabolism dioxygenase TauD, TfdA family